MKVRFFGVPQNDIVGNAHVSTLIRMIIRVDLKPLVPATQPALRTQI